MSFNLANIFEIDSVPQLLADGLLALVVLCAGLVLMVFLKHIIEVLSAQSGKKYRPSPKFQEPPFD